MPYFSGSDDELPDREQPRHVGLRLGRQILADAPEVAGLARGLSAFERALHVAFARVVARDREQPIAELLVHGLEIVERRARRFEHVAPTVEPPVLLEPEPLAGARDELPEAGRAAVGISEWVERALDDRQQRELGGHVAPLELVDDVVEVEVGALEHAVEVRLMVGVPVELARDRGPGRLLGPREAAAQPRQQVALLDDRVAVAVRTGPRPASSAAAAAASTAVSAGSGRVPDDWHADRATAQAESAERGSVQPTPEPLVFVAACGGGAKRCRNVKVS